MPLRRREEWQQVDEVGFVENLRMIPQWIAGCFVSNIIRRTLAHVVGWDGKKSRMLKCTSGGNLKVASVGTGWEDYQVESGAGSDTYVAANTYTYTESYSKCEVFIEDNDAVGSFYNQYGTWLADRILPVGFYPIDFVFYGIKIKNRNAGSNTTYQLVNYR